MQESALIESVTFQFCSNYVFKMTLCKKKGGGMRNGQRGKEINSRQKMKDDCYFDMYEISVVICTSVRLP